MIVTSRVQVNDLFMTILKSGSKPNQIVNDTCHVMSNTVICKGITGYLALPFKMKLTYLKGVLNPNFRLFSFELNEN